MRGKKEISDRKYRLQSPIRPPTDHHSVARAKTKKKMAIKR